MLSAGPVRAIRTGSGVSLSETGKVVASTSTEVPAQSIFRDLKARA